MNAVSGVIWAFDIGPSFIFMSKNGKIFIIFS